MPANVTEADYQAYCRRVKEPASAPQTPGARAKGEDKAVVLLRAILASDLPGIWCREFVFHEQRNFRLDIACVDGRKLGAEVDGQVHRLKDKFARDIAKHNALTLGGWRWIRCTPAQVDSGEALELVQALVHSVTGD